MQFGVALLRWGVVGLVLWPGPAYSGGCRGLVGCVAHTSLRCGLGGGREEGVRLRRVICLMSVLVHHGRWVTSCASLLFVRLRLSILCLAPEPHDSHPQSKEGVVSVLARWSIVLRESPQETASLYRVANMFIMFVLFPQVFSRKVSWWSL